MTRTLSLTLLLVFALQPSIFSQDTLPGFSIVAKAGNKILISWTNRYTAVNQISIQRSIDSIRNFTTILTVPDPSVLQNGFVDNKALTPHMFYRLFIVMDNGKYVFTRSRRPGPDIPKARVITAPPTEKRPPVVVKTEESKPSVTVNRPPAKEPLPDKEKSKPVIKEPVPAPVEKPAPPPEKYYFFRKNDSITLLMREKDLKRFRDSIAFRTKDTLVIAMDDTIEVRPFVPKNIFRPSRYIFTGRDGNINIVLPEVPARRYSIKFFEDDGTPVFDIRQVKTSPLILDKANFLHAGWFKFELYEDGRVKEKNKVFIPKEF